MPHRTRSHARALRSHCSSKYACSSIITIVIAGKGNEVNWQGRRPSWNYLRHLSNNPIIAYVYIKHVWLSVEREQLRREPKVYVEVLPIFVQTHSRCRLCSVVARLLACAQTTYPPHVSLCRERAGRRWGRTPFFQWNPDLVRLPTARMVISCDAC